MKALKSPKNKQYTKIPHKNTLETKTIRIKSWPYALLNRRHTPAIALVVAGFLIGLVPPAQALVRGSSKDNQNQISTTDNSDENTLKDQAKEESLEINEQSSVTTQNGSSEISSQSSSRTSISDNNNAHVRTEVSSNQSNSNATSETSVSVNGTPVEPDSSGRIREDFKDENSDIRIRGKIDSDKGDGSTSIDISTNAVIKP